MSIRGRKSSKNGIRWYLNYETAERCTKQTINPDGKAMKITVEHKLRNATTSWTADER
jgi:hypothetical protein